MIGSEIIEEYDLENISIATLGSHSALQILKGAKELGFRTVVICKKGREEVYRRFRVADKIIVLDEFIDVMKPEILKKLKEENAIMIPHGSLIAYVGVENIKKLELPIFGNRILISYEGDRKLEREWLTKAGLKMPKEFKDPREIDRLVIVKFAGAKGGRGYFLASSYDEYKKKVDELLARGKITEDDIRTSTIQEYVFGVNMYFSYFYSPLNDEVEFFGIDRRYETNVDNIGRIPARDQLNTNIEPSYVVVGNFPLVARESLLPKILEIGDNVVEISKKIAYPGLIGPFCIETMVTDRLEIIAFEISVRIVAGTNVFTQGSPYSYLLYGDNVSMGKRIAMEIKRAVEENRIKDIVT